MEPLVHYTLAARCWQEAAEAEGTNRRANDRWLRLPRRVAALLRQFAGGAPSDRQHIPSRLMDCYTEQE